MKTKVQRNSGLARHWVPTTSSYVCRHLFQRKFSILSLILLEHRPDTNTTHSLYFVSEFNFSSNRYMLGNYFSSNYFMRCKENVGGKFVVNNNIVLIAARKMYVRHSKTFIQKRDLNPLHSLNQEIFLSSRRFKKYKTKLNKCLLFAASECIKSSI